MLNRRIVEAYGVCCGFCGLEIDTEARPSSQMLMSCIVVADSRSAGSWWEHGRVWMLRSSSRAGDVWDATVIFDFAGKEELTRMYRNIRIDLRVSTQEKQIEPEKLEGCRLENRNPRLEVLNRRHGQAHILLKASLAEDADQFHAHTWQAREALESVEIGSPRRSCDVARSRNLTKENFFWSSGYLTSAIWVHISTWYCVGQLDLFWGSGEALCWWRVVNDHLKLTWSYDWGAWLICWRQCVCFDCHVLLMFPLILPRFGCDVVMNCRF